MTNADFGFGKQEREVFRRLASPEAIQHFLDHEVSYNKEPTGPTFRSPRRVLSDRTAHCIEGAVFATAALRMLGRPPLILDLEAVRDDDHVIAVFRDLGHWGAIAKSNYSGLRFREPVYRTLRELVMSYFELYFNLEGEKSLRRFSRPVNLARFDRIGWMTASEELWKISDHLAAIPHRSLLTRAMIRRLRPVDRRLYEAGLLGSVP
jgi:hypothetical protein